MFGSDGGFLAQQQGLFAALVTNPGALINNPRKGNDNDRTWTVNEKAVPAVDTPVTITIVLQDGRYRNQMRKSMRNEEVSLPSSSRIPRSSFLIHPSSFPMKASIAFALALASPPLPLLSLR
jgi:hypothetical protein